MTARKPTALRVIEGNPSHRPLPANEPKPQPVAPRCPIWLAPEAKREWYRVAPELERLGLLTIIDKAALAGYCQAWAEWRATVDYLGDPDVGYTFTTPNGYIQQRPEVAIGQKALQFVRAFCADFGLSPSSRSRMSVGKLEPDEEPSWLD